MPGTDAALWTREIRPRLRGQAELNPEWGPWLGLVERTLKALDDPAWDDVALEPASGRDADSPLLHGARVVADPRPVRRWVRRLLKDAASSPAPGGASLRGLRAKRIDAPALLSAAASGERERVAELAEEVGVDGDALAAVAQLAVIPLLHALGRKLKDVRPEAWPHGWCPVCGAWPLLAEMRGLDRARRLRCGRCAAEWARDVLHCAFCGERGHEKQGALVPDGDVEVRRVETCSSCKGHLKAFTTLAAIPPGLLLLEDLESVELDLAAMERGYGRPERPGRALDLRVETRRRAGFGL